MQIQKHFFIRLYKLAGILLMGIFVFIVMIDPSNTLLHKKDIAFILVVLYNIITFKPDLSKLPYIFLLFCALAIPWLSSMILLTPSDETETLAMFKSISPSLLLLWANKYDLIKISRIPVLACCIICLITYAIISSDSIYEEGFWMLMQGNDNPVMVSNRSFLGIKLLAFYLKSCVSFVLVYSYYMLVVLNKTKLTIANVLCLLIITAYFLISGTRSTMLVPFFLFIVVAARAYKDSKYLKYIMYPVIFFIATAFVILILMLATQTDETSNAIKYGHLNSYLTLFYDNPIYLLLGQGPGTSFFSDGFGGKVFVTEWSYLELIRCFGIFSTLIIYVFFKPLITFWKDRNYNDLSYCMFWSYLAYLLIAGTNPLLLSSTGMITMIMAYSYEDKIKSSKRWETGKRQE